MSRKTMRSASVRHGQNKVIVGRHSPIIVQSMTSNDTADAIATAIRVRKLPPASRCDDALHLALTEVSMDSKGIVASSAALAALLQEGTGDTIHNSLKSESGDDRTKEVIVAQELLQTMGLRRITPMVIACPGCGCTTSTIFQNLADRNQTYPRDRMPVWTTRYPGVAEMNVDAMGHVVNRASESRHPQISISLTGTVEDPSAPVLLDGVKTVTLRIPDIGGQFQAIVENDVQMRYGTMTRQAA